MSKRVAELLVILVGLFINCVNLDVFMILFILLVLIDKSSLKSPKMYMGLFFRQTNVNISDI